MLRQSEGDRVTVIAAGVTLYEALSACDQLQVKGINIRVIDLYCVKPLDVVGLAKSVRVYPAAA